MAKTEIGVRKTDTIFDELDQLQRRISERAYRVFCDRPEYWGDALGDWLAAERDLVWKPAVEVRQKDGTIEILAALPGVEPKDVDVQAAPEDVLIKAAANREYTDQTATVHACEIASAAAFRSIHLPMKIDPGTAKAEYRNGMLRLTATIAKASAPKAAPKKVDIRAA